MGVMSDWMAVLNDESEAIPPYAIVEAKSVDQSTSLLRVGLPVGPTLGLCFFNGGAAIPVGGSGQVCSVTPARVAYQADTDQADEPAHGDLWGPRAGSWYLHKGEPGFLVVGDGGYGLCNVMRDIATDTGISEIVKSTATPSEIAGPITDSSINAFKASGITTAENSTNKGLMLLAASKTQAGTVTTGSQNFAGSKLMAGGSFWVALSGADIADPLDGDNALYSPYAVTYQTGNGSSDYTRYVEFNGGLSGPFLSSMARLQIFTYYLGSPTSTGSLDLYEEKDDYDQSAQKPVTVLLTGSAPKFKIHDSDDASDHAGMTGTVANPTSITIKGGIVTACS